MNVEVLKEMRERWLAVSKEYDAMGMTTLANVLYDASRELETAVANHSTLTAPTLPGAGGGDGLEKVVRDVRWRIEDVREMLMSYRGFGEGNERLYGCDEWSTPTVNLKSAMDLIDAALPQQGG